MHPGILADRERRREALAVVEADSTLTLCGRCGGTGNEFYSMFRRCTDCDGVGVVERRLDGPDRRRTEMNVAAATGTTMFGIPGAEQLYGDLDTAFDAQVRDCADPGDVRVIEEWSAIDPISHLPTAEQIIERILEDAAENGEIDEWMHEDFADHAPIEEMQELLREWADAVTYRMADKRVGEHRIVVTDDHEWVPVEGDN